jgi:hypothetical protein
MKFGSLLFALFLNALPLLGQQAATVSGSVVNSVTGQTVKKAVVTLRNATGQTSLTTVSDQSGKFHFDNVAPDRYSATAQASGYSDNMRSTGKPVVVAAQQEVQDVEVRIPPLASISGKVVDENGQPMAEVNVMAVRYVYIGVGGKRLQTSGSAQTNDRGEYRMFDLQPERYYLIAMSNQRGSQPRPADGENVHSTVPEEGYAPVFYPGVADISQASPQEIKPGAEWAGADFKLRQLPTYHIRGTLSGGTGARGGRTMVRAQWCGQDESELPFSLGVSQSTGTSFDVSGAAPGTYCLMVQQPAGGGMIAAKKVVTVKAGDIDGIEFAVPPAFTLNGTVTIDGTPPTPMPQINIGLYNIEARGSRQGNVAKSDGSFQIDSLYPGSYTMSLPQGQLYAKSILYGSQDVTNGVIPSLQPDIKLTITLGTDPGEIDGTVQPGSVESGAPVLVAAIPEDAYAARTDMQKLAPSAAGTNYSLANVPPGNYKVFALETSDFGDVMNRDLMKLLDGNATAVTVTASGHQQVSVTAIPAGVVEQAKRKLN